MSVAADSEREARILTAEGFVATIKLNLPLEWLVAGRSLYARLPRAF